MYKGVGWWERGGVRCGGWWGRWETRGGLCLPIGLFGVAMSPRNTNHISLDKPGGPKRRLTNTGVNIRPIPPI